MEFSLFLHGDAKIVISLWHKNYAVEYDIKSAIKLVNGTNEKW